MATVELDARSLGRARGARVVYRALCLSFDSRTRFGSNTRVLPAPRGHTLKKWRAKWRAALDRPGRPGEAQIEVPAFTLDELAERMSIDRIDLLKMNIEGAERLAVRGMTRALATTQHVVISCHDFLAAETGDEALRTKELMISALTAAGFDVETRADKREFVADYAYGTRNRDVARDIGSDPPTH